MLASRPRPSRSRRLSRSLGAVVLTAVGTLTVAACDSPTTVAYVGQQTISQSDLKTAVSGVTAALQQPVAERGVASAMITGALADQVAAAHNIPISDDQREKVATTNQTLTALMTNPAAKQVGFGLIDEEIVSGQLGTKTYASEAAAFQVRVNPRYGTWSSTAGQLTGTSGSLSVPEATATPTP